MTLDAGERQIEITHADRVIFPDADVTKDDLVGKPEHDEGTTEQVGTDQPGHPPVVVALLYVVNQGAFELHTLLAPADRADRPDELIIDLDAFVNSTGSRGIHIHVMLDEVRYRPADIRDRLDRTDR